MDVTNVGKRKEEMPSHIARRHAIDDRSKIISRFNMNIRKLIRVANNLIPGNKELMLMDTGATRLNSHLGDLLINELGPEIYIYRKLIVEKDFKFLININYQQTMYRHKAQFNKINRRADDYFSLIKNIIEVYQKCTDDDRNDIHQLLSDLLKEYCKYLLNCRKYPDM